MLGVVQESVRPLWANTYSYLGHSCPGCWWTVFGGLHTLFSWKNKGFHSQWCWIKWVPLFVSGRCTKIGKDLAQSLNKSWEEPNSNWLQEKGRLIEMILGIRTQESEQRQRSQWLHPRNQKSSILSYPRFFPSLLFDGFSLATFFLKASTLSEGVQATCPKVLNPKDIT